MLVSWLISFWQKPAEVPFRLIQSGRSFSACRSCFWVVPIRAPATVNALEQGTLWFASDRTFCSDLDRLTEPDSDLTTWSSGFWFSAQTLWSICCSAIVEPQRSCWTLACLALRKKKKNGYKGYKQILECPLWLVGLESSALDHTYIFWSTVFFVFVGLFKGSWVSPTLEKYSDLLCSHSSV